MTGMKELGADGKIILICILQEQTGRVNWIDLAQDMKKLQSFVNTAMNLRVS
jgi:hypothetical protein